MYDISSETNILRYMWRNKGMGKAAVVTQIILEREFGDCDFLHLYSSYVSNRILENMMQNEECDYNDDNEEINGKTTELH